MEVTFKNSTATLLKSKTIEEEITAANELKNSYKTLFSDLFSIQNKNKETIVNGGIALSPKEAIDCLDDSLRTVRFLKGVYLAIRKSFMLFPSQKIEIVYAGSGPLATLIIPLLHLFNSKEIAITIIDINKESINSVKLIVEKLHLQAYFRAYKLTNAITYKHPKKLALHLVITETMDKALIKEPQVEITRNLASQLIKKGLLIPEKITVSSFHSFFAKTPSFTLKNESLLLKENPIHTDKVYLFSITKHLRKTTFFNFESEWIHKPNHFHETPDICIETVVQVFEDLYLENASSFITNPHCIKSLYAVKGMKYKLKYSTQPIPKWTFIEEKKD